MENEARHTRTAALEALGAAPFPWVELKPGSRELPPTGTVGVLFNEENLGYGAGNNAGLRYLHMARATARAVRVRMTRRRRKAHLARLKVERADLFAELMAMAEGLELPGTVAADGRVAAREEP